MKKQIPIFFAVDNNYAPNLSVVIESIKENSSKEYEYDIYVLNENISIDYMNKLNKYNKDNVKLTFVDVSIKLSEISEKLPTRDYYSNAIFYRLLIPELFKDIDKAVYLDADIIILGDVSELYNHNVDDYYLGVVKDDVASSCSEFRTYTKEALGVDSSKYFNSGILVMNLKKFRDDLMWDKFINLLKKVKFFIAPDQDYLNVLCLDKVLYVSELWNMAPLHGVILPDDILHKLRQGIAVHRMSLFIASTIQFLHRPFQCRRIRAFRNRTNLFHHIANTIGIIDHNFFGDTLGQIGKFPKHLFRGTHIQWGMGQSIGKLHSGQQDLPINLILRAQKMNVPRSDDHFILFLAKI